MSDGFVLFGAAHLGAIVLAFLTPLVLALAVRAAKYPERRERQFRLGLAALLILTWVIWLGLLYQRGWLGPGTLLPMNLCDWAAILTIVTMLRPGQRSYELAYFWALGGTLQALLTPDLHNGFPDLRFIVFFLFHSGIIAGVLYLTFATRLRPWPSSIPRVMAWSVVYLAMAMTVNALLGTNFGYLSAKPRGHSLLDLLAPWPWYIWQLVLIGFGSLLLYYAPFFLIDRLRKRKKITR